MLVLVLPVRTGDIRSPIKFVCPIPYACPISCFAIDSNPIELIEFPRAFVDIVIST
jgi:hypothetical protein